MRRWLLTAAIVLSLGAALQAGAVELLTNGDFELSSPPKGYAPGWSGDQGFSIIGPAAWFWGVQPQRGQRALGVASNSGLASGRLGNSNSSVPSGDYKLRVTGWVWLQDNSPGDGYESFIQVKVWVDDKIIRAQTFRTDFTPQFTWLPVEFEWRGHINSKVSIELFGQADGRGPNTWGVICSDNWSIDATLNPPPVPNLLTNGGFEEAVLGTNNPGPGWNTNGLPMAVGWNWRPRPYGIWNIEYISPNPYNGDATMHVGDGCQGTGVLEQSVNLPAGNYTLTFTGHVVVYDNEVYMNVNPYCDVQYRVDGYPVYSERIYFEEAKYQGQSWKEIRYTYRGQVNSDVGVWVQAVAPIYEDDVIIDEFIISPNDTTPPTTPVVTDDGVYQQITTELRATWGASDPESGIMEYQYSVGTQPGLADVAGWISNGANTSATRSGLSLQPGQTYYINVKARNFAGLWSDVGSSDGITITHQLATIGQAKLLPDGTPVFLSAKIVTDNKGFVAGDPPTPGTDLWIEETDRSSAIHIPVISDADIGGKVNVQGLMATTNGERTIANPVVHFIQHGTPESQIKPVALSNRSVGGGPLGDYTPGIEGGVGLNNVAMLVSVFGVVKQQGADYFYIDDGSGRSDGTMTGTELNEGIRILWPPDYLPGTMVRVEGILEVFEAGGSYHAAVRPLIDEFGMMPRIKYY